MHVNVIADNYDGTFEDEWKDNFYDKRCPVPDFEYTNPLDFGNLLVCGLDSLDIIITNTSEGYSLVVFSKDHEISGTQVIPQAEDRVEQQYSDKNRPDGSCLDHASTQQELTHETAEAGHAKETEHEDDQQ